MNPLLAADRVCNSKVSDSHKSLKRGIPSLQPRSRADKLSTHTSSPSPSHKVEIYSHYSFQKSLNQSFLLCSMQGFDVSSKNTLLLLLLWHLKYSALHSASAGGYSRCSVVPVHEDEQHGCQEEENSQNNYCHLEMVRNKTKTKLTVMAGIGCLGNGSATDPV